MIFKRKKQRDISQKEVWRDSNGEIVCPGDSCPKECDESCPIYLNTIATTSLMTGEVDKALSFYEAAVSIAPDFDEVWNYMGALHGRKGDCNSSYDCYLKAHNADPSKSKHIFGLALASRDLKQYRECVEWCEKYEAVADDHQTDSIKEEAIKAQNEEPSESENQKTAIDILVSLLEDSKTSTIMDYRGGFPQIAEVMMQARIVCGEILSRMLCSADGSTDPFVRSYVTLMWCAFAGMGATAMWYADWPELREKGIVYSLTEERGIDEMDEFVLDYIGIEWGSEQSDAICNVLKEDAIDIVVQAARDGSFDDDYYFEGAKAMYMYGMIFQMSRMGMH